MNYRRLNKRRGLGTIDENASIKIPRFGDSQCRKTQNAITTDVTIENQSSEENIPASQEHTQRFLSQRSIALATTLGRTQSSSRILGSRQPNSYFELVLLKAGVQLDDEDTFMLSCDHIAIVCQLREAIESAPNYPDNVATFKTGLIAAMASNSKLLRKLLIGCTINADNEETVYQSHNSMFVNFLLVDSLREPALEVLLNKIEEVASAESELTTQEGMPLLPLLLSQLRFQTLAYSEEVYQRLKGIFSKASEPSMMHIIDCVHQLLNTDRHDDFVDILLSTYRSNTELFNITTVNALINLTLCEATQKKLRARIVKFVIEETCSDTILPHLVRLLMNTLLVDNNNTSLELITTLREICTVHYSRHNLKSQQRIIKEPQLEIFRHLELGLMNNEDFYNTWHKTLHELPASELTTFDFIMLLVLLNINDEDGRSIENILRIRIKQSHIQADILEKANFRYAPILKDRLNVLMYLLYDFMQDKHLVLASFAKSSYSILFGICESTRKQVITHLLSLICDRTRSENDCSAIALYALYDLEQKYPVDVQSYASLMMPLLDRLPDFTLSQTRMVMEVLCAVAFPAPPLPECPQLQEQIDMHVKKLLIGSSDVVRKQGLIGSVQLIHAIAQVEKTESQRDELNLTIENINDLPEGRGKQAATLTMLTESAFSNSPESVALFYDELATIFKPRMEQMEKVMADILFLKWLSEIITFRFQQCFVIEKEPPITQFGDLKLALLKCINKLDETINDSESEVMEIAINVAGTVLTPSEDSHNSILVLSSLFNSMQILQKQRYQGSLEAINALLGCAIVLPSFFDDDNFVTYFCNFEIEQQNAILLIYFHTVNWMRVSICAFSSQKHPGTRARVLKRLRDLVKLEQNIKLLLACAPSNFEPPQSQFLTSNAGAADAANDELSSGSSRPTLSLEVDADKAIGVEHTLLQETQFDASVEPSASNIQTQATTASTKTRRKLHQVQGKKRKPINSKIDFVYLYGPLERYRQLDMDILLLLEEESFSLAHPLTLEQEGTHVGLPEFRFILNDLVQKLDAVVNVKDDDRSDCSEQYVAQPVHFMTDLKTFLPQIYKNLLALTNAIDEQLEKVNHVHSNLDLFTEYFNYVKACFGLCIRVFTLYFSWRKWLDKSQEDILKSTLCIFFSVKQAKQLQNQSIGQLAVKVFHVFQNYRSSVLTLSTAVQLQRLLHSLSMLAATSKCSQQLGESIQKCCGQLLHQKWYDYGGQPERGTQCNIYLNELVKCFLKDSPFARQKNICQQLNEDCTQLNKKGEVLESFPNFNRANFPLLYRGLCEILISQLNTQIRNLRGTKAGGENSLHIWETTVLLKIELLEMLHKVEIARNTALFIKYSELFLKLLLSQGLRVLGRSMREHKERVSMFLKNLQTLTRFLHKLCCHSKNIKNTAILGYIPMLRENVENIVLKVKALLAANKCHSMFEVDNLLNKDIEGDDILEPITSNAGDESEANSDEELPEDDITVEKTILNNEEESISTSRSSISTRRSKSSSRSKCF